MKVLKTLFATYSNHIVLSLIAIIGFTLFHITADLLPRNELTFVTSDAVTYNEVAQWITTGEVSESLSTRPLLYPFVLMIVIHIFGQDALFWVQAIFWLIAVNVCFSSLSHVTRNKILPWVGAVIFMSNLSLMALTAHALTELITILILSVLVFVVVRFKSDYQHLRYGLKILTLFVALTLTKPVFFLPTVLLVCLVLIFYKKLIFNYPKRLVIIVFIISPLILQMSLVYSKFDVFKVSTISSRTFSRYFVAQGITEIENIHRTVAIKKSEGFSKSERWQYVLKNRQTYIGLFLKNIRENIKGAPIYLKYPGPLTGDKTEYFMKHYNHISYVLHRIMFFIGLVSMAFMLSKKNFDLLIVTLILFTLNVYLLVVSGISFHQGDRLTISNIAIWTVLYPVLAMVITSGTFNLFKKKKAY